MNTPKHHLDALRAVRGLPWLDIREPQEGDRTDSIASLRNSLINNNISAKVKQGLLGPYSDYIFIDDDIGFALRDIEILLDLEKDIVGGVYPMRKYKHQGQGGYFKKGCIGIFDRHLPYLNKKGTEIVDFIGAGFLKISRNCLKEIAYPWFRQELIKLPNECAELTSEDSGFCINAKRCGYDIYATYETNLVHER